MSGLRYFAYVFCVVCLFENVVSLDLDYGAALTKSFLYYEAQRSGVLPRNQRVHWRGNSALQDGRDAGVDLVGGYYDAGDNVKFGFPMAFTVTMLAWSVVQFGPEMQARHELPNALRAIKWGTDYMMKAHTAPNVLYGQVGDGRADHACWQRPEEMATSRPAYKIDEHHPGSDLAGETAAALAASAVAFKTYLPTYSSKLVNHAKQLFAFATNYTGQYQNSIPGVGEFYSSSGYEDELQWAGVWLALATNDNTYIDSLSKSSNSGGTRSMFSWDDKFVGVQTLIAKLILEKKISGDGNLNELKKNGEQFICNCIQKGNSNIRRTNGGLAWFNDWANLQYVATASFVAATYADILTATKNTIECPSGVVGPNELINFAKSQVDYILGSNPMGMSYMVGFGSKYPKRIHHRGASIVSMKIDPKPVSCGDGFGEWFHKIANDPNVVEGAVVGGPDFNDAYNDERENFQHAEPAIATAAPLVGVLARLASN